MDNVTNSTYRSGSPSCSCPALHGGTRATMTEAHYLHMQPTAEALSKQEDYHHVL